MSVCYVCAAVQPKLIKGRERNACPAHQQPTSQLTDLAVQLLCPRLCLAQLVSKYRGLLQRPVLLPKSCLGGGDCLSGLLHAPLQLIDLVIREVGAVLLLPEQLLVDL